VQGKVTRRFAIIGKLRQIARGRGAAPIDSPQTVAGKAGAPEIGGRDESRAGLEVLAAVRGGIPSATDAGNHLRSPGGVAGLWSESAKAPKYFEFASGDIVDQRADAEAYLRNLARSRSGKSEVTLECLAGTHFEGTWRIHGQGWDRTPWQIEAQISSGTLRRAALMVQGQSEAHDITQSEAQALLGPGGAKWGLGGTYEQGLGSTRRTDGEVDASVALGHVVNGFQRVIELGSSDPHVVAHAWSALAGPTPETGS
jgi:hypothetical protein